MNELKVARFLGWFSIGLGLVEMISPRSLGRFFGLGSRRRLLRWYGLREMAAGLGILAGGSNLPTHLWGRVVGDIMDWVTLWRSDSRLNPQKIHIRSAEAAVAGITALDAFEAWRLRNPGRFLALRRQSHPVTAS